MVSQINEISLLKSPGTHKKSEVLEKNEPINDSM